MAVHFLISYQEYYMAGLHHRACDIGIARCTGGRTKEQGSFLRRNVNCGNCKRTNAFKQVLKGGE